MSVQTTVEIPGVHDRLREAYAAALEDEWERFDDLVLDARSNGLKRKAELRRGGKQDV